MKHRNLYIVIALLIVMNIASATAAIRAQSTVVELHDGDMAVCVCDTSPLPTPTP